MPRIEWTRLSGPEVEDTVAMLLCRRFPNAHQIRASQGDGGIDVLVPIEGGVAIYQVKKFASNLTGGQKKQVVNSLSALRKHPWSRTLPIVEWHLVLPLNSTPENEVWFAETTKGAGYPCDWRGLAFVEALASEYPEVIDYYLRAGKDRLDASVLALTELVRGREQVESAERTGEPLQPVDVVAQLQALGTVLNLSDPFYEYEVSVSPREPDMFVDRPKLVMTTHIGGRGHWVSVSVFARCAESVVQRPIPLAFTIHVDGDRDLKAGLEDFEKYGVGFAAPMGTVDITADLPGGLGGSFEGGALQVLPAGRPSFGQPKLRLQVLDESDVVVAETMLHIVESTQGLKGTGTRFVYEDADDAFTFEVRYGHGSQVTKFVFELHDVTGRPVYDVLNGVRTFGALRTQPAMRLSQPWGPADRQPQIPIAVGSEQSPVVLLVESLSMVQDYVDEPLVVPPLDVVTSGQLRALERTAALIRVGHIEDTWTTRTLHQTVSDRPLPDQPVTIAHPLKMTVHVGQQTIQCGAALEHLLAARVVEGSQREHEDHMDVDLEPADESRTRHVYFRGREGDLPSEAGAAEPLE